MAQILIRNLDDETVARLKARASQYGRSLQSEVKLIIEEAARQNHAQVWEAIHQFRQRLQQSGRAFSDSVELIREDRDR